MKDLEKEKIERMERRLLKAHRVSADDLQEIVSAPQLFDKINARIKAEQAVRHSQGGSRKWAIFSLLNPQKIGLASSGLAVFLTVILSLIFFTRQDFSTAQLIETVKPLEIQRNLAAVDETEPEIRKVQEAENKDRKMPERIVFKNKTSKIKAQVAAVNSSNKLPRAVRDEMEEEFYPLAFTENLEEAKEDGKVIRVELSRSSLLALGLNPPMDDEAVKVKTDLLLGSDGVARGIRFVK
ncbi:MAG TPA: hypothetical protein VNB22_11365 [Pyrinomonadaceae bacterium]|nr:hypothetical protein [Pyrinomonadaceae bacterium]